MSAQLKSIKSLRNNSEFDAARGIIDYANPDPANIYIDDIALGLSRINRFLGQMLTKEPYSVALHSVWVSDYIMNKTGDELSALYGLLHDAHEAYTGDIPKPLKNMPEVGDSINKIEYALQKAIYQSLQIPQPSFSVNQLIHEADEQALLMEAFYFKDSFGQRFALPDIKEQSLIVDFYGSRNAFFSQQLFVIKFWDLVEVINSRVKH